jgi:hypothetical protein
MNMQLMKKHNKFSPNFVDIAFIIKSFYKYVFVNIYANHIFYLFHWSYKIQIYE